MKVDELQRRLDEGFLDNLVSKVQAMAGGDGPTGVVRALRGQNAALVKFADAIANAARPKVMQRVGNQLDSINNGSAPLPVKMIYQQLIAAAERIAAADKMNVDAGTVNQAIRSNRSDIERLILSSNVGDNNEIKLLFDTIVGGTGSANISMKVEPALSAISMIVAATVIFIQTSQEDDTENVDEQLATVFDTVGVQLIKALALKDSPIVVELKADETYKDRVEELVVNLTMKIKTTYLNLDLSAMSALANNPTAIVSANVINNVLGSHSNLIDEPKLESYSRQVAELFNKLFASWTKVAESDSAPGRPKAYKLFTDWASKFLNEYLGNLELTSAPVGQESPQPGKEAPKTNTGPEKVFVGGQEVKPSDDAYDKIMAAVQQ